MLVLGGSASCSSMKGSLEAMQGTPQLIRTIQPQPGVVPNYEIGQVRSAAVGEAIFDVRAGTAVQGFRGLQDLIGPRSFRVDEGDFYTSIARLRDTESFIVAVGYGTLVISPSGVVLGSYNLNTRDVNQGENWPESPLFRPDVMVTPKDGFRAEMIYSGIDGSTVLAAYREFSGDFIRPAFSQELRFNIAQDRVIAYKTIRIEVVRASNSAIEYRVVEDGGLPWLPR
jgi:hypothetical protein